MAMRLAENTSNSVAVIEAGGFAQVDAGNTTVVPRLGDAFDSVTFAAANSLPSIDWNFETTPQTALNGTIAHYWRGKALRGTSELNNAVYQRGSIQAYDMWADLVGDESYKFEGLLPYFKMAVEFTPANAALRPANATVPPVSNGSFCPSGGPVKVSYSNYAIALDGWMAKSFEEIGIPEVEDFVSGKLMGYQYTPQSIDPSEQTRSSSQTSYLNEALFSNWTNLQVYPNTLAKRILFSEDKIATGVQVTTAGMTYTIFANHEVIISAGVFKSPQLLMVSGIGPAATLQNLSIPVIAGRPGVGQNMWDHVESGPIYPVNVGMVPEWTVPSLIAQSAKEYQENRTGAMTGFGLDFLAFTKLPTSYRSSLGEEALAEPAKFPEYWPAIELVTTETPGDVSGNYALIYAALVAPLSRVNVTINSTDTRDPPIINPKWLSSETDQKVNIEAFKLARALFNSTAIKPILRGPELVPGESVQSDEEILNFIKGNTVTLFHASCTCAMGRANDTMAVIDSKARVIGVSGLRIVDTSSFPILLSGHSMSTVFALAEKIADDINSGR